jgi:hypothetical protein
MSDPGWSVEVLYDETWRTAYRGEKRVIRVGTKKPDPKEEQPKPGETEPGTTTTGEEPPPPPPKAPPPSP